MLESFAKKSTVLLAVCVCWKLEWCLPYIVIQFECSSILRTQPEQASIVKMYRALLFFFCIIYSISSPVNHFRYSKRSFFYIASIESHEISIIMLKNMYLTWMKWNSVTSSYLFVDERCCRRCVRRRLSVCHIANNNNKWCSIKCCWVRSIRESSVMKTPQHQ